MGQFHTCQNKKDNLFLGLGICLREAAAPPTAAGKASTSPGASPNFLNACINLTLSWYKYYMFIILLLSV